jgi:hypothetical protein
MRRFIEKRPTPAMVIALIALFVTLGGTAIALPRASVGSRAILDNSVTGFDIKNNSVRSRDIRDNAVQGIDVNESTLGTVPNANNANAVGGTGLSDLLRASSCQTGKVLGFARIKGGLGITIPTTYTTSSNVIDVVNNCAGRGVQVRRISAGEYRVRFLGNPAFLSVVSPNKIAAGDDDNVVSSNKITVGSDTGAFAVHVQNVTSAPEDGDLTIVLP